MALVNNKILPGLGPVQPGWRPRPEQRAQRLALATHLIQLRLMTAQMSPKQSRDLVAVLSAIERESRWPASSFLAEKLRVTLLRFPQLLAPGALKQTFPEESGSDSRVLFASEFGTPTPKPSEHRKFRF